MLTTTYHAVLKGNRLEWSGEAPPEIAEERAVSVDVTIHRDVLLGISSKGNVGERMAAALEKLAAANATADIEDPVAWQREVRRDRVLIGRG